MVKIVKNPGNGRLNNLNYRSRPQCVKAVEGIWVTRGMQGRDDRCNKNLNGIPHGDRRKVVCEGGDGMHLATEFDELLRCLQ